MHLEAQLNGPTNSHEPLHAAPCSPSGMAPIARKESKDATLTSTLLHQGIVCLIRPATTCRVSGQREIWWFTMSWLLGCDFTMQASLGRVRCVCVDVGLTVAAPCRSLNGRDSSGILTPLGSGRHGAEGAPLLPLWTQRRVSASVRSAPVACTTAQSPVLWCPLKVGSYHGESVLPDFHALRRHRGGGGGRA